MGARKARPARPGRWEAQTLGRRACAGLKLSDGYSVVEILVDLTHCGVALAGFLLQAIRIHDMNAPAAVTDEALALQGARGRGHRGSPRTQHDSQKLLRQVESVVLHAVAHHQEPARQAFF